MERLLAAASQQLFPSLHTILLLFYFENNNVHQQSASQIRIDAGISVQQYESLQIL
jgi:hypothetical protein